MVESMKENGIKESSMGQEYTEMEEEMRKKDSGWMEGELGGCEKV